MDLKLLAQLAEKLREVIGERIVVCREAESLAAVRIRLADVSHKQTAAPGSTKRKV